MKTLKCLLLAILLVGTRYPSLAQKPEVRKPITRIGNTKAMHLEYAQVGYDVFVVNYPAQNIQLFWKGANGQILKSLGNLKAYTSSKGKKLLFAANAGMYTTENGPKGLYIENGKELKHIDLKKGPKTNFYMQPNGVFYTTAKHAYIATSGTFNKKEKVLFATQSGPMLVVDGVVNSQFTKGSANINIRNGVGIDKEGRVYFVISSGLVNFYDFAMFFKEKLNCRQALFLDGGISRTYLPELKRMDEDGNFGVMVGVTE